MRQSKREIQDKTQIIQLLEKAAVGRLGTVSADGHPMIKPLNFIYVDNKVYFHGAKEGEKIEDMRRENRVCFEVDEPIGYVRAKAHACEASYLYRSVVVKGTACVVEDREEKMFVLTRLMRKYQSEGGYDYLREDKVALTAVVRIDITEMTGKERLA